MENDDQEKKLKPVEYKRDEDGKFERQGRTIAKSSKNQLRGKKGFQPGMSGNPAGKKPGTLSKVTVALKQAILDAGELAGGEGGLTGYLRTLAIENSSAYAGLLGKILPAVLAADAESSGRIETRLTFRRVIVMPNGQEIEAKQIETKPVTHLLPSSNPAEPLTNDIKDLDDPST